MNSLEKLVHYISKDNKSPTTRQQLANYMCLTDRECRDIKRKAFIQGIPIITSSDQAGMYIKYDRNDIMKVRNQANSRMLKDIETIKACDRMLETINQEKL